MKARLTSLALGVVGLLVISFGMAFAFPDGDYDVDIDGDGSDETVTVLNDEVTISGGSVSGFAWDVETGDAEIEFLFVTDTEDAVWAVELETSDGTFEASSNPKDWDEDKIQQVLNDDDDDGEDPEEKFDVCHNGHVISVDADGRDEHLAEHPDDTAGDCPAPEPDDEAPPGEDGRENARANGGNAHGYGANGEHGGDHAPGRNKDS